MAIEALTRRDENTKDTKDTKAHERTGLVLSRTRSVLDPDTDDLIKRVIGCALHVHRALGPGYLEAVYHDAMAIESHVANLSFEREVFTPIRYRDRVIRGHRLDLVVAAQVVVELKAVEKLEPIHTSQVVAYLRASGLRVGLLMNFNTPVLKSALRRIVL